MKKRTLIRSILVVSIVGLIFSFSGNFLVLSASIFRGGIGEPIDSPIRRLPSCSISTRIKSVYHTPSTVYEGNKVFIRVIWSVSGNDASVTSKVTVYYKVNGNPYQSLYLGSKSGYGTFSLLGGIGSFNEGDTVSYYAVVISNGAKCSDSAKSSTKSFQVQPHFVSITITSVQHSPTNINENDDVTLTISWNVDSSLSSVTSQVSVSVKVNGVQQPLLNFGSKSGLGTFTVSGSIGSFVAGDYVEYTVTVTGSNSYATGSDVSGPHHFQVNFKTLQWEEYSTSSGTQGTTWNYTHALNSGNYITTANYVNGRYNVLKFYKKANLHAQVRPANLVLKNYDYFTVTVDYYPYSVSSYSWGPTLQVIWETGARLWIKDKAGSYAEGGWVSADSSQSGKTDRGGLISNGHWYRLFIAVSLNHVWVGFINLDDGSSEILVNNARHSSMSGSIVITLGTDRLSDYSGSAGSWETYYYDNFVVKSYQPLTDNIVILNNNDFAQKYSFPGSGTPSDPYIIEGYYIGEAPGLFDSQYNGVIEIQNTNVHLIIKDNWFVDNVSETTAIWRAWMNFNSTSNVIIRNNLFFGLLISQQGSIVFSSMVMNSSSLTFVGNMHYGDVISYYLDRSTNITITRNVIINSSQQLVLDNNANYNLISYNLFMVKYAHIFLRSAKYNLFHHNTIVGYSNNDDTVIEIDETSRWNLFTYNNFVNYINTDARYIWSFSNSNLYQFNYFNQWTGPDNDADGLVDTPFLINGGTYPNNVYVSGSDLYPTVFPNRFSLLGQNTIPLVVSNPIVILSDADFQQYSVSGSGTAEDPYIIEGLKITGSGTLIKIENTTAYFIIRNNILIGDSAMSTVGIAIHNAVHGLILENYVKQVKVAVSSTNNQFLGILDNTIISAYSWGIAAISSSNSIFANNYIINGGWGILLDGASTNNNIIFKNDLENNDNGIYIGNSNDIYVLGNTIIGGYNGIIIVNSQNIISEGNIMQTKNQTTTLTTITAQIQAPVVIKKDKIFSFL